MRTIEQLDAAIKAVAPIHGVAILRPERESEKGWDVVEDAKLGRVRIDFADEATDEQRKAAIAVAQTFEGKETIADKVASIQTPELFATLLLKVAGLPIPKDQADKLDQATAAAAAAVADVAVDPAPAPMPPVPAEEPK